MKKTYVKPQAVFQDINLHPLMECCEKTSSTSDNETDLVCCCGGTEDLGSYNDAGHPDCDDTCTPAGGGPIPGWC